MIRVLTAYNDRHAKYIEGCRQSVKAVFDDCVHHVQYDNNKGKAWAMNQMLTCVEDDDVVIVLDADDTLFGDVALAVASMREHDVIYGNVFEQRGLMVSLRESREFDYSLFKKKNFIPYSGTLVSGWIARRVKYPDIYHGNDWLWWHRIYQISDRFKYSGLIHCTRSIGTSYKDCKIPVYRKLKRLYYERQVKKLINELDSI